MVVFQLLPRHGFRDLTSEVVEHMVLFSPHLRKNSVHHSMKQMEEIYNGKWISWICRNAKKKNIKQPITTSGFRLPNGGTLNQVMELKLYHCWYSPTRRRTSCLSGITISVGFERLVPFTFLGLTDCFGLLVRSQINAQQETETC